MITNRNRFVQSCDSNYQRIRSAFFNTSLKTLHIAVLIRNDMTFHDSTAIFIVSIMVKFTEDVTGYYIFLCQPR